MAGIEISQTGIEWVDKQLKEELNSLQSGKFDKDISIKYLQKLNKNSYQEMMSRNSGTTVVAIQVLLKELGYDLGKIDGILKGKGQTTSKTMEAVKAFQKDAGFAEKDRDGIPGPLTVNKLLEKIGSGAGGGGSNTGASVNKPQQTTTNKPQKKTTPEKASQSPEMTLNDLYKLENYDVKNLGTFGKNSFVFKKGVEKHDNKGKYIVINGKKVYELGNNKDGIYYKRGVNNEGTPWFMFGQFKNGSQERGVAIWSDGGRYIGQFKNNLRNGRGTQIGPDHNKYVGQWKAGEAEGKGSYAYSDGYQYIGQFKASRFGGWGILYHKGKKEKEGIWKGGDFMTGVKYDEDGKTVLEKWVNGKRV